MNIQASTVSGKTVFLGTPLQMQLCESFDTPADAFVAVFFAFEPLEELEKIVVKSENQTVFEGNVDEQITMCNKQGIKIKISARSFSQLIDNEALPTTYIRPALDEIFKNHLEPFGIKGVIGNGICQGDFAVSKGTCHWAVVEQFCKCVLNSSPRITKDRFLDTGEESNDSKPVAFGNFIGADCRYFSAKIKYRRYGVVGEICYKSEAGQGYERVEINQDAKSRNIKTKRYLNLSASQKWERQHRLQREFDKSIRGSEEIELCVPFDCFFEVGSKASFCDERLGNFEDYRIFEIAHSISVDGNQCKLTLRPSQHLK